MLLSTISISLECGFHPQTSEWFPYLCKTQLNFDFYSVMKFRDFPVQLIQDIKRDGVTLFKPLQPKVPKSFCDTE